MEVTNNDKSYTFLQLLSKCTKVVIPKIQRDYAQGRKDPIGSNLCEEVRNNFINSIKSALTENTPLVLDYIYGSKDNAGFFYPIDGQQRLTTLFLLHWYVAIKEQKMTVELKQELSKFSYEIRDTAKEFCLSLLDISFDVSTVSSLKDAISDSSNYYKAYDEDPTVQAMIVMLEKIHTTFKFEKELYDRLNNITFWVLFLERFGLTDDLFVKMNARGKRLSKFDTFKSELESALDKHIKENPEDTDLIYTTEIWKQSIDNDFLDSLWCDYKKEFAERNIYRIIMFFVNCIITINDGKSSDFWETNDKNAAYDYVVKEITTGKDILANICSILGRYDNWKTKDPDIKELLLDTDDANSITHYVKVRLFGVLYWWAVIDEKIALLYFDDFYRILCNYVISSREYAIAPRQFHSSIDAKTIGGKLRFVKKFVDGFKDKTCDFYSYIRTSDYAELDFEKQKLNYTSLDEIIALEKCPALRLSIHNFFFDDCIYVKASEINAITQSETLMNLTLRIILSFSNGRAGDFLTLVFDDTRLRSGRRQLFYESETDVASGICHKILISDENVFGDKILTSTDNTDTFKDLSNAVKAFAKIFHSRYYGSNKTIEETLNEILQERLLKKDFSNNQNILWYLVAYSEFFYNPSSTTFLLLRRKHYDGRADEDNVYDMRCTNQYYDPNCKHYNPFYKAVKNKLEELQSNITIKGDVCITGNQIEYKHPCMLSNDWQIRILKGGNWRITFNENVPKSEIVSKYNISEDSFILNNVGEDCIELITDFIMECN